MKILVNKALRILKIMPKIIKSIKETENNEKNSNFNLGRNPMEIVHGPLIFHTSCQSFTILMDKN
jgi:hypothetical protein